MGPLCLPCEEFCVFGAPALFPALAVRYNSLLPAPHSRPYRSCWHPWTARYALPSENKGLEGGFSFRESPGEPTLTYPSRIELE